MEKQSGPDFRMRLGDEKQVWQKAAEADGINQLGTWVKKVVRDHIKAQNKPKKDSK